MFVTIQAFTGNLGGVAGADGKCQTLARAANRPGTFEAWLGNASISAFSRMARAQVPYTLVDGTVVAKDFTGLTSGTLLHGIDITELGTKALGGTATDCFFGGSGILVWTNANPVGSITTGTPKNLLTRLKLEAASGWPAGIYFFGDQVLRVGIVVASELPAIARPSWSASWRQGRCWRERSRS